MTMEQLAAAITGREYPPKFLKEETDAAKAAGLVICYGASDDLVEFEGAIHDEIGAYEGTKFRIDALGLRQKWSDVDRDSEAACEAYSRRKSLPSYEVKARWDPGEGYSWKLETEMPHATFEIVEDGEPFCRGIVFALPREGDQQP